MHPYVVPDSIRARVSACMQALRAHSTMRRHRIGLVDCIPIRRR